MEEESWRRDPWGGILEKESWGLGGSFSIVKMGSKRRERPFRRRVAKVGVTKYRILHGSSATAQPARNPPHPEPSRNTRRQEPYSASTVWVTLLVFHNMLFQISHIFMWIYLDRGFTRRNPTSEMRPLTHWGEISCWPMQGAIQDQRSQLLGKWQRFCQD